MRNENADTIRLRRRSVALLLAAFVTAAIGLAGCGGGSDQKNQEREGGEEAEKAQAEALSKIPVADRTAFFQLATAIGALRARAAPVAVGSSTHLSSAEGLRAARAQIGGLRPDDPLLVHLRDELTPVLDAFSRAPRSGAASKRASQRAIAQADHIEAGLRSYTQRTPAIGGAIPD